MAVMTRSRTGQSRVFLVAAILLATVATSASVADPHRRFDAAQRDLAKPLNIAAPMLPRQAVANPALTTGRGRWLSLNVPVTDLGSGGTREVRVFTPPVTDAADLPVVYLLHGLPGGDGDLCTTTAATGLVAAFRAGVTPFILACPDGNPTSGTDSEWADSADGRTKLETFVTRDAIRAVEGSRLRSRSMRAIGGFSMGGFAAASIALRHPELYGLIASFAGYFHLDDPDRVFGSTATARATHDPTALLDEANAFRWYIIEAGDDDLGLTAHDSERYVALLRARGVSVKFAVAPGGHAASWVVSQLPALARFLSALWHQD
jgi:S-formylglutathione hydrolase FrmB